MLFPGVLSDFLKHAFSSHLQNQTQSITLRIYNIPTAVVYFHDRRSSLPVVAGTMEIRAKANTRKQAQPHTYKATRNHFICLANRSAPLEK